MGFKSITLTHNSDQEEVTSIMIDTERQSMVNRLWAPYETENFNLKKLIAERPVPLKTEVILIAAIFFANGGIKGAQLIEQDVRPSKMLYYTEEELGKFLPEGVAGRIKSEFAEFSKKVNAY